jgi:hypothetical protein
MYYFMENWLNGKNNVDRLDFSCDLCYNTINDTSINVVVVK